MPLIAKNDNRHKKDTHQNLECADAAFGRNKSKMT